MKRGKPLQRRTPLVAKTQLRRTALARGEGSARWGCGPVTPDAPGTVHSSPHGLRGNYSTLRRSGPINQVSAKRKAANRQRTRVVSAMRLATRGQCARCGRRDLPVHGHERLARAHGGDIVHPDCVLCPPCNGWAEDYPQKAAWLGWKISTKWPHNPTLTSSQAIDLDGNIVEFTVTDEEVA